MGYSAKLQKYAKMKMEILNQSQSSLRENHIQANDENTKSHGSHRPTPFERRRHNRIQVFA
tara:strand:+ start:6074 stop:6256 length:183 start_codon:yes stop_codon:yes gene_type:complete